MPSTNSQPRQPAKAALFIVGTIAFIIVVAFVGMNSYHAKDLKDQQAGQMKPEDKPQTEKDLGKLPAPSR